MRRKHIAIFFFTVACSLRMTSCDGRCNSNENARRECGWLGINRTTCEGRSCCWNETSTKGTPWCFHQSNDSISSIGVIQVTSSWTEQSISTQIYMKSASINSSTFKVSSTKYRAVLTSMLNTAQSRHAQTVPMSFLTTILTSTISTYQTQRIFCPEKAALSLELDRKNNTIIALSVALAIMSIACFSVLILACKRKTAKGRNGANMNGFKLEGKSSKDVFVESPANGVENNAYSDSNTYDQLCREADARGGVNTAHNNSNSYDHIVLDDKNPYYAST